MAWSGAGAWASVSGRRMRLIWSATMSPTTVTAATSSVSVTVTHTLQTSAAIDDPSTAFVLSGGLGASTTSPHVRIGSLSGGSQVVSTRTVSVPLAYGKAQTLSWSASMSGLAYIPTTAKVSGSVPVPARPLAAPAAPSGVQVTQSSDTRHVINWTRNSPGSASAPYQNQVIQRSADNATPWKTVATVGNVSSWTDTTTTAGRRYQWRVAAKNSGGTSAYATSPTVYTTPAPPTSVKAVRQGLDVLVSWVKSVSPHSRSRLAWRQKGGPWQYPGWTSTGTSYLIKTPDPSLPLQYAVLAEVDTQGKTLTSPWVHSPWVQLLAPPAAPTSLSPALADAALPITLSWRHNAVDSSEQSAREIRWRPVGTSAWNGIPKAAAAGTTHVVPVGLWEPGTVEWQVRTWGAHADPSPWSVLQLTRVAQAPAVTIASPAEGPLAASQAKIVFEFFDPEGEEQAAGSVQILDDEGSIIYQRTWEHASRGLTPPVRLQGGRSYTIRVRARAASGLWSEWDQVTVSVDYPEPPVGVLTAEWLPDSASVMLTVVVPPPAEGEAEATSAEIWRSVDGGDWLRIAAGLPVKTALVDPTPHTSRTTAYRLVTVSDLPSTAEAAPVLVAPDPEGWIWLNAGPGWSRQVRMRDNARTGPSWSRASERHHMAGSSLPVAVRGEQVDHAVSVSVRLAPNPDGGCTYAELEQFFADADLPILYRDAKGRRWFADISEVSGSEEQILEEASFTVYEIDHVEAEAEAVEQ